MFINTLNRGNLHQNYLRTKNKEEEQENEEIEDFITIKNNLKYLCMNIYDVETITCEI